MAKKPVPQDTDAPHYRATAVLYLDRLVDEGEEFYSDDTPGLKWEPLNEAAELAIQIRDEAKAAKAPTLADQIAAKERELQALKDSQTV